jgi:hypothetical protein
MIPRLNCLAACLLLASLALPTVAAAQGRGGAGRGGAGQGTAVPRPAPVPHGEVFVGGYFYDPVHGPYPWWPRPSYPFRYFPVYDVRASVRLLATPRDAAVYVDGFYAGCVDDFDGLFQRLRLTPGGHEIVLYLAGYRTARHHIYLGPGASVKLRDALEPLPPGETSEPPSLAPPLPPPPGGVFRRPAPRPGLPEPPRAAPVTPAAGMGTLDLHVHPAGARVTIDGQEWLSSDARHVVVELSAGAHRVQVSMAGYQAYSTNIEIVDGETLPLNVSLAKVDRR